MTRSYDSVGNRKTLSADFLNGGTVTKDYRNEYSFDALNRLTKITQTDEPDPPGLPYHQVQDKRIDFDYNALGQFASIKRWENLAGTGTSRMVLTMLANHTPTSTRLTLP